MKSAKERCFLAAAVLFFAASISMPVLAGLSVGQQAPEINASDWLNTEVPLSLARLRGKMVVVEFFATWCPPCRDTIPHLVELSIKYASKGVVIISLTRERKGKVETFAKDMGMTYPVGTGSRSGSDYGVRGIPHAFIVSPQGVMLWHGHPGSRRFEQSIEKALVEHPPVLVSPAVKAKIEGILAQVEKDAAEGRFAEARKRLPAITRLDRYGVFAEKVVEIERSIGETGKKLLQEAAARAEQQDYAAALALYNDVERSFRNFPEAKEAAAAVTRILRDPEAKKAAAELERSIKVEKLLQAAKEQEEKGNLLQALSLYKKITRTYPGTEAAADAQSRMQALEQNSELMSKARKDERRKFVRKYTGMGRTWYANGQKEKAISYYVKIVEKYAGTAEADIAQARIDQIRAEIKAGE